MVQETPGSKHFLLSSDYWYQYPFSQLPLNLSQAVLVLIFTARPLLCYNFVTTPNHSRIWILANDVAIVNRLPVFSSFSVEPRKLEDVACGLPSTGIHIYPVFLQLWYWLMVSALLSEIYSFEGSTLSVPKNVFYLLVMHYYSFADQRSRLSWKQQKVESQSWHSSGIMGRICWEITH